MSAARIAFSSAVAIALSATITVNAETPAEQPESDLNARVLKMLAKKSETGTPTPAPAAASSAPTPPASTGDASTPPPPAPTAAPEARTPDLTAGANLAPRQPLSIPDPTEPAKPAPVTPAEPQNAGGSVLNQQPKSLFGGTDSATHSPTSIVAPKSDTATYTIASGDNFTTIAKAKLGDANKWALIAKANPSVDPTRLKIGQVIKLPGAADVTAATTEHATAKKADATAHTDLGVGHSDTHTAKPLTPADHTGAMPGTVTVATGDSLHSIARRVYGSPAQWRSIYDANRDKLSDPDDLKVGMVLKVPAAKTAKSN